MIDENELMKLAEIFDNKTTKVLGVIPKDIKLSEVIGISSADNKTTKVSFSRNGILYLCWVKTADCIETIIKIKEKVSDRKEWDDRWEAWEIHGSSEPWDLMVRLIRSRLKTPEERTEFFKTYMSQDQTFRLSEGA